MLKSTLLAMPIQVFVLPKCCPIAPSLRLPLENLETIPRGKKDAANSTRCYILGCLLRGLWQRGEQRDLVVNVA